ncbi:hypothetical protein K438DRAFT_1979462 [Mycena galopus ATCC 62051]|nr:hypothetical protein K438DRAFT_1979462 [Mycena galopus ATCC 62051]
MFFSFHRWVVFIWMLVIAGSVAALPILSDSESHHPGDGTQSSSFLRIIYTRDDEDSNSFHPVFIYVPVGGIVTAVVGWCYLVAKGCRRSKGKSVQEKDILPPPAVAEHPPM